MTDLHTHSTYSDGTLTPRQLVQRASEIGLTAIALTDHNNVGGIPQFLSAADEYGVNAVAGAEFSTEYNGVELHIVALFIDECHLEYIGQMMDEVINKKRRCYQTLIDRLNAAYGCKLDLAELEKENDGPINRVHIARKLMKLGLLGSVREGFDTVLSAKNGFYVPPKRINALDMIKTINGFHAVSVLAHPYLSLDEERLQQFLPHAAEAGLAAIECFYSTFSPEQTAAALKNAARFGLLPSGGSDFHGENKPDISLGRGTGNLNVPDEVYFSLKQKKLSL